MNLIYQNLSFLYNMFSMENAIKLLQFMIVKDFRTAENDFYSAEGIHSNLKFPSFPARLTDHFVVTCWKKDTRFHKEVIEYETSEGAVIKTAPMDIEPLTSAVIYRWHKHAFPVDLVIENPCTVKIRVVLDWKVQLESELLIEAGS